jgi:hypothetical protein
VGLKCADVQAETRRESTTRRRILFPHLHITPSQLVWICVVLLSGENGQLDNSTGTMAWSHRSLHPSPADAIRAHLQILRQCLGCYEMVLNEKQIFLFVEDPLAYGLAFHNILHNPSLLLHRIATSQITASCVFP